MKVLDLFSGIGGFSLGLERAGMQTVAFCEKDPDCWSVLKKNWPDVPIFTDIRGPVGVDFGRIDVISGGFPCQPFSTASAGKREGKKDDRYLWPSMLAVIEKHRPTWVIGENVVGIDGMAFGQVVSDLESKGFEVQPLEIPSCAVGRDHWRPRIWFLAHSDSNREHGRTVNAEVALLPGCRYDAGSVGEADGVPGRMDRLRMLGNSVDTEIPYRIGRAIMQIEGKS